MKECPSAQEICDLLADRLSPNVEALLAAHVEICPRCLAELEVLTALPQPEHSTVDETLSSPNGGLGRLRGLVAAARYAVPTPNSSDLTPQTRLTLSADAFTAPAVPASAAGRYRLDDEIGRGGMGAVWRAYDPDLKRTLAVKIMLGLHRDRPPLETRFLEEAQVTAQLQHPGIPPVHEIGRLEDGRPFFAMKLIEGRTLAELLQRRTSPSEDLPRFVAIFGQVCQAVAYAHKHGILHRDLKPSNLMVGAFGEVQVMDWGLAKHLADRRPPPEAMMAEGADPSRSLASSDRTQAGTVLGTPAYMAPEQARGEIEQLDERADVFGLGAILCATLTAEPPFRGPDGLTTLEDAACANLTDAFARLDACGADAELVRLAKQCLAPDREKRPRQGQAVAEAVDAYQAGVLARLRTAELERTRAEVQAGEERKRRRLTLALVAALLVLVLLGGVIAWWSSHQRAARHAEETKRRELMRHDVEATLRQAEALQQQSRWTTAGDALALAARRADEDDTGEITELVEQARHRLAFVRRLATIRLDKSLVVDGKQNKAAAPAAYAAAFRQYGFPVTADQVAELPRRISALPIKDQLVAALEDWALGEPDEALRATLWQITEEVEQQPWRRAFRDKELWRDEQRLAKVVGGLDLGRLSPALLAGLGEKLETLGGDGVAVLEKGWKRHPSDFWLSFALGDALNSSRRQRWDEAVGYYRAALALRPDSPVVHHNLGGALYARKDLDGAEAAFRRAIELDARLAPPVMNLGMIRYERGDVDGAIVYFRQAIALDGRLAVAHTNLGAALKTKADVKGALAACRRAVAVDPGYFQAYYNLGGLLADEKDFEGAITAHRKAIELAPTDPISHRGLGNAFFQAQRWTDAIAAYCRVTELAPRDAAAHLSLGQALYFNGDKKKAIAVLLQARELAPKDVAISTFLVHAYRGLGYELFQKRNWDESIAASRQALALAEGDPTANMNLVRALFEGGRFSEACEACRTALRVMPAEKPGANDDVRRLISWTLQNAEQMLEAERQLVAVLEESRPQKGEEWLRLALLCKRYKNRPAAAARFYASAFAIDNGLTAGSPTPPGNLYRAACAASSASSGKGDGGMLDEKERARLRQQALTWLRAELTAWSKLADKKELRPRLEQTLLAWQKDEELAGVREVQQLAKLPEPERADWGRLWDDVAALLRRARLPATSPSAQW